MSIPAVIPAALTPTVTPRLVLELEQVDRTTFVQSLGAESRPELKPAISDTVASIPVEPNASAKPAESGDTRPESVYEP